MTGRIMPKSKLDYEEFFYASPMAHMVLLPRKDSNSYEVMDANQAAAQYFDLKRDEMLGQRLSHFLEADNSAHIMRALGVCMDTHSPVTIQALPKLPGGLRAQSFVINPILDENNHVKWLNMQARPVPYEHQAIERERDDAISLLASIFDVSEMGIIVIDHHGRIVKVNEAFLYSYQYKVTDLVGHKFTVLLPEKDHNTGWEKHKAGLNDGLRVYGEGRLLNKGGDIANVIISSVRLELSQKRCFMVSTIVDISHLKVMEKRLRKAKEEADAANIAKSAFLANMSHELRTPLNAIIGFSDMMLNETLGAIDNVYYKDYLGDIHFSANHLLAIINGVLDMSKIEAGKMRLDEEPTNMTELLESVRRITQKSADDKQMTLKLRAESDVPDVVLDMRLIRQVLINLVSNAVKFSGDGKIVEMSIENGKKGVVIDVIDHGIGIPENKWNEVLQPFGQVNDPSINAGQGTGLGLPLSKAIMELHGGTLKLKETKAGGMTVRCTFPHSRIHNAV